jgi:hypothetical protein
MNNKNQEFDFDECRRLFNDGMLKDHLDAKNYISKFFCPLISGQHTLIENNSVTLVADDVMRNVYMKRWDKKIREWYNTETNPKKLICDLNKPMIGSSFMNVSKQLIHEYKQYETFDNKIKTGVETMLSFIKEIWANNDQNMYQYLLNWLSDMIKGKKNKSCLYAKSIEGVGKSTLPEFLRDFVVGNGLFLKGKSDHLKGEHNMQLLGKLFVVFEELQIFSEREWHAIDAELKDLITDDMAQYTDKYEKRVQANNSNNYMILTNFDLKGAHGRRMCVLEINTKYLNNFEFFSNLRKECFNNEVGHAFYCYLKEIDTSNFQSHIIPETQTKRELYLHLLPAQEKFLKKFFVLRHAGINMKRKDLFDLFKHSDEFKQMSAYTFYSHLSEIGFKKKSVHHTDWYKISYDELLEFGKKRKWFGESDKELFENAAICIGAFDNEDETKIYVDKAKYLETNTKVEQLENQLKIANDLMNLYKTLDEQIKSRDKVTQNIYDIIGMMDARYEKQFKQLNEHINEVSLRVATLEVDEEFSDDESDNISERDESDEEEEEESDEEEEDSESMFIEKKELKYTQIAHNIFLNERTGKEYTRMNDDEDLVCDNIDKVFNF